jgi:LysM repeat protein
MIFIAFKLILRSLKKFLFVFIILAFTSCDNKPTQQDLQNAITLDQTLRNKKNSASKSFSQYPQPQESETCYAVQKHTLKAGETLQDLAVQYGTDWQSIQQANGIKDLNEIKPGQTILIPIKKSQSP